MQPPRKVIRPFHTVLVANRGEIAIRVMRSARQLGYRTVAVYSEADRSAPHVQAADRAVFIGGSAPRESYLNIAAIIEAAVKAGADAIHPGYGFLAENSDFADAVDAAGLVFIGPTGAAIRAMGNKAEAKRLVSAAGMPCIPGDQGERQHDDDLIAAGKRIGFPLMVKAVAGGGGRGMRLVNAATDLPAALASARSEARQAFGNGDLILERAVIEPRHVEIQILADAHGHCIHLGERDCSVQRRHQKVIEEAPSPVVTPALRAQMGEAAVRAAQAIGYIGAGTLEFLLDRDGRFYFMEMNTRLQVEHAVTEATTGLDLVHWQLRIAAGDRLALQQDEVRLQGHAIEVRLTAEDVPAGFLPQTGPVLRWRPPSTAAFGVRVDHGLVEGGTVSPYYDSMVAKLVAHGQDRDEARRKLITALEHCALLGVASNQGFLIDCLSDPVFAEGTQVHTGFVAARFGGRPPAPPNPGAATLALAAFAALAPDLPAGADARSLSPSPLSAGSGQVSLALGPQRWDASITAVGAAWQVLLQPMTDEQPPETVVLRDARWTDVGRTALLAECDGITEPVIVAAQTDALQLFHRGRVWRFGRLSPHKRRDAGGSDGLITAPLTGRIIEVAVREGDRVAVGQRLVMIEAMKMEHQLTAPTAGVVTALQAVAGGQAALGAHLMRIEATA